MKSCLGTNSILKQKENSMGQINNKNKTSDDKATGSTKNELKPLPKPKICCVDVKEEVFTELTENGYSLYKGTLGDILKIPNKSRGDFFHLLLDYDFPANFHEYDILVLDLTNPSTSEFKQLIPEQRQIRVKKMLTLICSYPTTIFDPRPLSSSILGKRIREVQNRKFIQIVFASEQYEIEYDVLEISGEHSQKLPSENHQLYEFNNLPLSEKRKGREVSIFKIREDVYQLLNKHLSGLTYEQTFSHPTVWDAKERKTIPNENVFPLMKNVNEEIISLVQTDGNFITFVFPNIKNKKDFLTEFIKNILPTIYPEVFPFSTQFNWVENSDYYLPNHKALLKEREILTAEFKKENNVIENKIEDNTKKFNFLHAILTETGEKLVTAIFSFLKWLEYKNVIIKDEHSNSLKEEDILVELENGILIIEVKGIGGTSTDSDCSQVSKIKHRRCKERNAFDVFALYIVNHQRYTPPLNRTNPPFNEQQIADAISDERGLLSTWQLFNLYNEVGAGLISKEKARLQILQYGHVIFKPKLTANIGQPKEILKDGFVVIIELKNIDLKVNDKIIIEKRGSYASAKILSLQLNNKDVQQVKNGEVGIKLDLKISKNVTLWT